MDDEKVSAAIRQLEDRLRADDGPFVRRFEATPARERWVPPSTAALLVVAVVLLSSGLAGRSLAMWCAGVVVVFAAFAVDGLAHLVDRLPAGRRRS